MNDNKKFSIRPQSEAALRRKKVDSWDELQEKLNFIKEENEELRRPIFG